MLLENQAGKSVSDPKYFNTKIERNYNRLIAGLSMRDSVPVE